MDEAIHFDLPGKEQRGKLLALYLDKYITKAGTEQVRQQQQPEASDNSISASLESVADSRRESVPD
jgi:hypothetical protein